MRFIMLPFQGAERIFISFPWNFWIKAIVFKVDSLAAAIPYLEREGLLGDRGQDQVQVKAPNGWEFRILLRE